MCTRLITALLLILPLALPVQAAQRVKDLVDVAGVRDNQLIGYGLVVGLSGTGDQTTQAPFTVQSIRNMLSRFGIRVPDDVNPQLKNVAAVTIHANCRHSPSRVSVLISPSHPLVMPVAYAVVV